MTLSARYRLSGGPTSDSRVMSRLSLGQNKRISSDRDESRLSGDGVDIKEGLPPRMDSLKSKHWRGSSVRQFHEERSMLRQQPLETLMEEKGEYTSMTHMPKPRDPSATPSLRGLKSFTRMWFPHGFSAFRIPSLLLWSVSLLWPYSFLGFIVSFIALYVSPQKTASRNNLADIHQLVGAILSFMIAFRTNAAYTRFYEAKTYVGTLCNNMRELVRLTYTALPKDTENGDVDTDFEMMPTEIRRRVNIVFAFLRQHVRESREGFMHGSDLENVTFSADKFYMDPVRPRLWDLLSAQEVAKYINIPVHSRAVVAASEILVMLQLHADKVKYISYMDRATGAVQGIHDMTQAMIRIRDTPVPFPYVFILNASTFYFVYLTPFLYRANKMCLFLGVQLLIFSYYALLEIGLQLENPFGYDSFDVPIEDFCRDVHDETLALATALGKDTKSFIPEHLTQICPADVPSKAGRKLELAPKVMSLFKRVSSNSSTTSSISPSLLTRPSRGVSRDGQ